MTKAFFVQLKREFGTMLLSPIAYVVFICMAVANGSSFLLCVYLVGQGVRDYTPMQIFFYIFFFWLVVIVLIPVMTMRLFSEEYKTGTIEPLLTSPIREWDVILAKFLAVIAFYVLFWGTTITYPLIFRVVAGQQVPLVWGPILLGYLMVLLIGMFWIAVGIFASSLTKNQIVAAITSFTIIALLFFGGFLSYYAEGLGLEGVLRYMFTLDHMQQFSKGFFDSRPVVFYLSGTALFLALTHRVMIARRLKSS